MAEILNLSATALLDAFRKKKLSPVEVAQACLARVHERNPGLNAFALICEEENLLQQARMSEDCWRKGAPRGPLEGVPVTIKDGAHVAGWPTREGSLTTEDAPQKEDSPVVARLRGSGAVFLGKTTLPEYGHKGVTDSPLTGITRNPWNLDKTSGGSSGGAAVAAAAGMGFLHHGTDGGGSIRIPANFCGVFGHKPSGGLVPAWPPTLFSTLSAAGPITRTVEDAALMLDVMSLPDVRDWHSVPYQRHDFAATVKNIPEKLRIAYAPTINNVPVDSEVARIVAAAAKKMDGVVGKVEEITLDIPGLVDVFNKHWMAVAAWLVAHTPENKRKLMDPNLRDWAAQGSKMALGDYLDAEHARMLIGHRMKMFFEKYDLLVLPVTPMAAFDAGRVCPDGEDGQPWQDWTPLTFPANLARLPAASVPCGLTQAGLPVGLQLMAGYLKDALVLRAAYAAYQS